MVSAAGLALAYQSQGKFAGSEPLAREAMECEVDSLFHGAVRSLPVRQQSQPRCLQG